MTEFAFEMGEIKNVLVGGTVIKIPLQCQKTLHPILNEIFHLKLET